MKAVILLLLLLSRVASLAAQSPVTPQRQVIRGVVELNHGRDAFDRAAKWSIDSTPLLVAGGVDDPDYDLTNANDFALLSDGSVVSLAAIGSRLFWFPRRGAAKSLTRQGSGPGELMAPRGMAVLPNDTLLILDGSNNRVNWVLPEKGFVREAQWPLTSARPQAVGQLRNGQVVFTTSGRVQVDGTDSVSRPAAQIVVASPGVRSASIVSEVPDLDLVRIDTRYRGRPGHSQVPVRFTRYGYVAAWDTVIATNGADGYSIVLRNPKGALVSTIRVAIPRRPVTKGMREAIIARDLQRLDGPRSEGMVDPAESRRIARETPFADSLPPHGRFFVSPDRILWVVDYMAPGDRAGGATAFRQDGAIIGRLTWQGTGLPQAFGEDQVLFRELDADGVVSLKVYRLRKGR